MDDTPVIQAMIDALPINGGIVQLGPQTYNVTGLNITNRRAVTIRGCGRETTNLKATVPGTNVLDFSGSGGCRVQDLHIDGMVGSATGILIACTAAYAQDAMLLDNLRLDGNWQIAGLYNLSVPSSRARDCQFYAQAGIPVVMTGNNFFGAASQFGVQINDGGYAPSGWMFDSCEFHNFVPSGGWACWLGGAMQFVFLGGNMSTQAGHIPLSNNFVTVTGGRRAGPGSNIAHGLHFYCDDGSRFPGVIDQFPETFSFIGN